MHNTMDITSVTMDNRTMSMYVPSNNINNETPLLPCLSRREGELFDDGSDWLMFVLVIVTAALMLTVFVSSIVYTTRRRVLRIVDRGCV